MVASIPTDPEYDTLHNWLYERAFADGDIPTFQLELVERLAEAGVALQRLHVGLPILHPLHAIGSYNWSAGAGVTMGSFGRGTSQHEDWLASPIRPLYENGDIEGRYRLHSGSGSDEFPMLRDLREQGATDYFAQLTNFPDRKAPVENQEGVVFAWASNAQAGFSDNDLGLLRQMRLPLSLIFKQFAQRKLVADVLDTYLGSYSGKRVLSGQVQRGDGDTIEAVILFCDLRRSSKLTEQYGLHDYLGILNQYYETTAGTVAKYDGEVLKFIGDASLAIFPFERFGEDEKACRAALNAAVEALRKGREINRTRTRNGEEPIEFGFGLHVGTVMYGNVGTPSRLDFTVIGKAANEAARIEGKCRELGEAILVSSDFVERLPGEWRTLGRFELHNVREALEILAPTDLGPA